jgi:hypothetical protein
MAAPLLALLAVEQEQGLLVAVAQMCGFHSVDAVCLCRHAPCLRVALVLLALLLVVILLNPLHYS